MLLPPKPLTACIGGMVAFVVAWLAASLHAAWLAWALAIAGVALLISSCAGSWRAGFSLRTRALTLACLAVALLSLALPIWQSHPNGELPGRHAHFIWQLGHIH